MFSLSPDAMAVDLCASLDDRCDDNTFTLRFLLDQMERREVEDKAMDNGMQLGM